MSAEQVLQQLVSDYIFSAYEYEVIESNDDLIKSFIKYLEKKAG